MTSWPSISFERFIYALIGLSAWSWAILTALWAQLFHKPGRKSEEGKLVRRGQWLVREE